MMPQMASVLTGFEQTMQFKIVKKTIVDHELVESSAAPIVLWFEGIIEPLKSRDLMIKPEGQRRFKWWTLLTDMELKVDDIIADVGSRTFRVMSVRDWSQAAYFEYELQEGVGLNND